MSEETTVKEDLNNEQQNPVTPEPVAADENQQAEAQPGDAAARELEILTAKYNEEKDKFLRLYSDFENFRKQKARERQELLLTAGSDIIKQLLPVLDDFDRAIISNENIEDPAALREGFKLIQAKIKGLLERQGLKEIDAMDQPFDTDVHEAITNIPAPSDDQKGKVVDVAEKGYFLNDKVLRFAKVIVGQ